jgi:hypothetical protein
MGSLRSPCVVTCLVALFAGCSASESHETGASRDAGSDVERDASDNGRTETGPRDASSKRDSGGAVRDDAPDHADASTLTGVKVSSGTFLVEYATSDDYAIVYDAAFDVLAVSPTGSTTQIVAGAAVPWLYSPSGSSWSTVVPYGLGGTLEDGSPVPLVDATLYVWSRALGSTQIATQSNGPLSVSLDGSYVIYTDSADVSGSTGNIGISGTDGSGAMDLVTGVLIDDLSEACSPWAVFDGDYAIVEYCKAGEAGTPSGYSMSTFKRGTAGWVEALVVDSLQNSIADKVGLNLASAPFGASSTVSIQGLASATQIPLSSSFGAPANGSPYIYLSNESTFVLFTQASGALGKATIASPATPGSPAPTLSTIASPGDVSGFYLMSPDEKWDVDYAGALDSASGYPTSLTLRNVGTGSATSVVAPGSSPAECVGFTSESSMLLYIDSLTSMVSPQAGSLWTGRLHTLSVTGGAPLTIVDTPSVYTAVSLGGTRIAYDANLVTTPGDGLIDVTSADLYVADATVASTGTLIATGASYNWSSTADNKYLFYSINSAPSGDGGTFASAQGLYVVTLP